MGVGMMSLRNFGCCKGVTSVKYVRMQTIYEGLSVGINNGRRFRCGVHIIIGGCYNNAWNVQSM
jgi:hypothetical protein